MDNVKNDRYYIQKIQNDLQFIVQHMKDVDIEELNANEILDSMLFRMIQLSENAKKLSDEYKEKRGYIPWNAMYGLRNRIVHDYGNVDLNIVFETLKNDIPELLEMIKRIMLTRVACRNDIFWCKFNTSKYKERQELCLMRI